MRRSRGLSLAELVLSGAVLLVYALAVLAACLQAQRMDEQGRLLSQAHRLARNQLEALTDYPSAASQARKRHGQLVVELSVTPLTFGCKRATAVVWPADPAVAGAVPRPGRPPLVRLTRTLWR
ncbi:MAG: hypothetical protein AMXMBFR33_29400 [Candidatus Xenobia bacterium]